MNRKVITIKHSNDSEGLVQSVIGKSGQNQQSTGSGTLAGAHP